MNITKVLVVDDSPTICEFLSQGLSQNGYQAIQAVRMDEALTRGELADVIVTDIIMPGMDGYEGIAVMKRRWPRTPVIAMSAGAGENGRDKTLLTARNQGADGILQKPFTIEQLIAKIEYLLSKKGKISRTRVLVVEDSKVQRTMIARMFSDEDYEVFEAETAEDALASDDIIGVDVMVTDIFMPGEGGLAVIQRFRKNWPNIRIVAMSGGLKNSMDGDKSLQAADVVGADATLKKPFSQEQLMATVNHVLCRDEAVGA